MLMVETKFNLGDVVYEAGFNEVVRRTIDAIEVTVDNKVTYLCRTCMHGGGWIYNHLSTDRIFKTKEEAANYYLRNL